MKKLLTLVLVMLLFTTYALAWQDVYTIDGGSSDRVHLRQTPSQAAKSLGLYFTGTEVNVVAWYDEWAQVVIGDVSGYMMSQFLAETKLNRLGPWQMVDNPSSTWVNLRMSPAMNGTVVRRLENGTSVIVLGETADGWSYVECQGSTGYIRTELLSAREKKTIEQRTTILSDASSDGYIHQYIAPNGQALYFTSEMEEPRFSLDDVNFDGWDDLVVMTISGATNAWYTFFTYDPAADAYTHVPHYGAEFINYTTYPQYGIIASYGKNGYAGLLHVSSLYRWEGNRLKQIRSAVSDEWSESIFEGNTYTQIIHGDILHVKVLDHTTGHDGTVIYERFVPMDDLQENEDYQRNYEAENAALWQGLK